MNNQDQPSEGLDSGSQPNASTENIARRAYELWEQDGRPEGNDMRHWLQAERELKEIQSATPEKESQPQSAATEGTASRDSDSDRAQSNSSNRNSESARYSKPGEADDSNSLQAIERAGDTRPAQGAPQGTRSLSSANREKKRASRSAETKEAGSNDNRQPEHKSDGSASRR